MQERRIVNFGPLEMAILLDGKQVISACLGFGKRTVEIKEEELKALYFWLADVFTLPTEDAIKVKEIADPELSKRQFTAKLRVEEGPDDPGVIDMAAMAGIELPKKGFTLANAPKISLQNPKSSELEPSK